MNDKKAIILLSGGIDSSTTAALAIRKGHEMHAIIFSYGQKHAVEILSAQKIADSLKIQKQILINIPAGIFRSALTDPDSAVPKNRKNISKNEIPDTYVPARNILFLSYALAYAESIQAKHIFIGANAVDYSGYPDCRPEFISAFQTMADRGTRAGAEGDGPVIETPLIHMHKSDIIKMGVELGVDYSITHSCYDPDTGGRACGICDSCIIRKKGFNDAGVPDPTRYQNQ